MALESFHGYPLQYYVYTDDPNQSPEMNIYKVLNPDFPFLLGVTLTSPKHVTHR